MKKYLVIAAAMLLLGGLAVANAMQLGVTPMPAQDETTKNDQDKKDSEKRKEEITGVKKDAPTTPIENIKAPGDGTTPGDGSVITPDINYMKQGEQMDTDGRVQEREKQKNEGAGIGVEKPKQ